MNNSKFDCKYIQRNLFKTIDNKVPSSLVSPSLRSKSTSSSNSIMSQDLLFDHSSKNLHQQSPSQFTFIKLTKESLERIIEIQNNESKKSLTQQQSLIQNKILNFKNQDIIKEENQEEEETAEDEEDQEQVEEEKEKKLLDIIGNGQLTKRIIKDGNTNIFPNKGDFVKINLIEKLENGTVITEKKNIEIQIGEEYLIQGLEIALLFMKVGEIAEIYIDHRFGYGYEGRIHKWKPLVSIPLQTNLKYIVELLDCHTLFEVQESVEKNEELRVDEYLKFLHERRMLNYHRFRLFEEHTLNYK